VDAELAGMRVDYRRDALDVGDLAATWHEQLVRWLEDATSAGAVEPNAMVLATTDGDGEPNARTVLCKGVDERGVVFYTNYTSAKSHELDTTRRAAATFPWYALQRQVNLRGDVERVRADETHAYWMTRPRGSQLGAWASAQSSYVADRAALDDALAAVERRFADTAEVPVPPHWGGWRVLPERVEFWQGRTNRMHDRLRFECDGVDRAWRVRRLAP
jgi:pyridoxamine 5'-phosphate oxidase